MGVFDGYKMRKSIEILVSSRNATDPEMAQASAKLKSLGAAAIPKMIDALAKTQTPDLLLDVLRTLLQNSTLSLFTSWLASRNTRIVSGVASVLMQSKTYDPRQLLRLFADPEIPQTILGKILTAHPQVLQPKNLLEILDIAHHNDCQVLLRLLDEVVTVDVLQDIIQRLPRVGAPVRLQLARILARFQEPFSRDALIQLLRDTDVAVRQVALTGLMGMQLPLDLGILCSLLRDEDRTIRRQVISFLIYRRDERILPYLFSLLHDTTGEARQGVLEVLNAVGTPATFRAIVEAQGGRLALRELLFQLLSDSHVTIRLMALEGIDALEIAVGMTPLLQLLRDNDSQVRRQAITLLIQCKDPQLFDQLFNTVQDVSHAVREGAAEVLDAISDLRVIRELLEILREAASWIQERVTETLGKTANANVVKAVLTLLKDPDERLRRQALDILQHSQNEQVLHTLLQDLQTEDVWSQTCAAEALAVLKDKRAVPVLLQMLQANETSRLLVAIRTLAALNDPQAIPPLLEHLQNEERSVREEVMRALAILTDATHARTVLETVLEARSTTDQTMRELANVTAITVIRKFGDHAVLQNLLASTTPVEMPTPPSTGTKAVGRSSAAFPRPAPEEHLEESIIADTASLLERPELFRDKELAKEAALDVASLKPGMSLSNRYRIIRQVGRGGFGTVFLAEDMKVREEIILKFLNAHIATDENMIGRFIHELRYARRVTHENVIRIHDLLTFGDVCAISMEYFPSHSLAEELHDHQPIETNYGLQIILDVCRGMNAAHQAKVVHRDLKPANILINDQGSIKIVDFGLAAAVTGMDTRLTATGAVLGTPAYMAPEQVRSGLIDARTDVYSLGIIMYELFTGLPPYVGDTALSVLFKHVEGKAVPPRQKNPQLSPALETVILQAMAVTPEQRFQSMEQLHDCLTALTKIAA